MSRRQALGGWTCGATPNQSGRVAVVTGASAGVGLVTARALAARGATVILACRNATKGESAATSIASTYGIPRELLQVVRVDLASLASVRMAAEQIRAAFSRLDLLINNAGVMAVPFARSEDGFELTFAINHLGHFAFTGLLLERLVATPGSRIATVSSNAHRRADIDLDWSAVKQRYEPGQAYDRSKLANLLFAYELEHRLRTTGADSVSLAAHPGNARTDLWRTSSRLERILIGPTLHPLTFWLAQSAENAAMPTLRAALDPEAKGGEYYGPAGWLEYTGPPIRVESSANSRNRAAQRRLWTLSEQLTGVSYPLLDVDDR